MIRAEEIQQVEQRRRQLLKDTYKHILFLCTRKIKYSVSMAQKYVVFEIPNFVVGFPMYDLQKCTEYIMRQLVNLGYTVNEVGSGHVYIRWSKKKNIVPVEEPMDEESLPSLMNLRKIASKIIKEDRNGGHRRSS
jgi:hypothetical protein